MYSWSENKFKNYKTNLIVKNLLKLILCLKVYDCKQISRVWNWMSMEILSNAISIGLNRWFG